MKKLLIGSALFLCLALSGCGAGENNVDVGSMGMLRLPDGTVVQGEIESLTRWTESMLEVRINGVTYCIHPAVFATIEDEG